MSFFLGHRCDVCGTTYEYPWNVNTNSKKVLMKWVREDGWSFGKRDLCPSCKKYAHRGGK